MSGMEALLADIVTQQAAQTLPQGTSPATTQTLANAQGTPRGDLLTSFATPQTVAAASTTVPTSQTRYGFGQQPTLAQKPGTSTASSASASANDTLTGRDGNKPSSPATTPASRATTATRNYNRTLASDATEEPKKKKLG